MTDARPPSSIDADYARAALRLLEGREPCPCQVVELRIDGIRCFVSFRVDVHEHQRRQSGGVGPATNRGLLHALWSLPEDCPVSWDALNRADAETLKEIGGGYVHDAGDAVSRLYRPAGSIEAIVGVTRRLDHAVRQVGQFPPIFWRVAVSPSPERKRDEEEVQLAERLGIGISQVHSDDAETILAPAPPRRGVPAVYRWWLSELAYRNWGYANCAHCTSCALGWMTSESLPIGP